MATNNISKGELFRRYQLQKSLEYEEEDQNEEQLEFNDQLESGKDGHGEQAFACEEEEAAKTSTCSNEASTKKRKKMQMLCSPRFSPNSSSAAGLSRSVSKSGHGNIILVSDLKANHLKTTFFKNQIC
jgi:hypothetical protein